MNDFKITKAGFYKRRNGTKFEIVGRDNDGYWIGKAPESKEFCRYSENGILRPEVASHETPNDAVAEWVEPKRIKGWLAIAANINERDPIRDGNYYAGSLTVGKTRQNAIDMSTGKLVACIEIDVLEGHGLNGEAA